MHISNNRNMYICLSQIIRPIKQMAFPPPFPNPLLPRLPTQPTQSVQFAGQKFGFFSHRQGMIPGMPMLRPRFRPNFVPREPRPPHPMAKPTGPPTTTTVFIGNISDKCPDRIIQEVLKKCGSVCNWKRLQDSGGKFKAFGFCDFMYPDGAKKALSVLKDFPLGEKLLNVKADEQTEKMLEEFYKGKLINANEESDEAVRDSIRKFLEEEAADLVDMPIDDGHTDEHKEKSPAGASTKSSHQDGGRSRSSSPANHRQKKKRSNKSPKRKKSRHYSSSSSDESSSFYSSASSTESKRIKRKKTARKKSLSSEDSDEAEERRKLKKEVKEREESYQARLKKWEEREKRMAKLYEKEREEEKQRQKTLQKEAKKLRQFLEDYVDERDDPKYYRGSALFQRKRNYEREREADAKDRQEERVELEEIRKSILEEKTGEGMGKTEGSEEVGENGYTSGDADLQKAEWETVGEMTVGSVPSLPAEKKLISAEVESPTPVKKTIMTTLQQKQMVPLPKLNGVFQEEDEEEVDTLHQIKKKIKPFEITREDRLQSMTPEERKKMIKDLITRIPTDKVKLFAFEVCWEFVDENLMEQRVRPWVNKKICEYIGEEEQSLVSFICEKISNKSSAGDILQDLSMVLDDEAEVFMVKLWRLIVYESEAKRLGLNAVVAGPSRTPAANR